MPINRREFGKTLLGALGMYALGTPKNAKALEEGEPSYYFNQFNTDIFAPIRTSDITPSNIQSRWRRIGSRPERTLNAFIDNNHLCFTGNGTVDVVHSNGTNRQYYDALLGPLDLAVRFTVAGEYGHNIDDKALDFGFIGILDQGIGYKIIPGENPIIIFKDSYDESFSERAIELKARESYTPRIQWTGEKVIASLKQDGIDEVIVEKPLSDIYSGVSFIASGGSPSSPYDFKVDWLLIKGPQVNPEGSDQLSRADINLDAEVDSIDAHLFADKFARGEANQSDLLVFIEEFQARNPEDTETMAFLQSLRTSSVEGWEAYR